MSPKKRPQGMPLKKKTGPTFLDSKLAALGFDTYVKYLASPHWRTTRRRYYEHPSLPKDCICGATEDLDLHHMTYFRLGAEPLEDLRPLCKRCHLDVHLLIRQGLMDLQLQGYVSDLRRARYARERRDRLRREGVPQEDWPAESYDTEVWDFNARMRHLKDQAAEKYKNQTRREFAREMRNDSRRRERAQKHLARIEENLEIRRARVARLSDTSDD